MSTEQTSSGQTEKYKNFTYLDVQSNHDIGEYRSKGKAFPLRTYGAQRVLGG
jgi:hypothetical protein